MGKPVWTDGSTGGSIPPRSEAKNDRMSSVEGPTSDGAPPQSAVDATGCRSPAAVARAGGVSPPNDGAVAAPCVADMFCCGLVDAVLLLLMLTELSR